jgi:GTPase
VNTPCIALLGPPNVGKSTLINALLKQKVAITSPKPNTTQSVATCVGKERFHAMDTPGYFNPRSSPHEKAMIQHVAQQANVVLWVTNAQRLKSPYVPDLTHPIVVLTQWDAIQQHPKRLAFWHDWIAANSYVVVPVSGITGMGISVLKQAIHAMISNVVISSDVMHVPHDDWQWMAELVREKLFRCLFQEIPYQLSVKTVQWNPYRQPCAHAQIAITVHKKQHQAMIIGKGGDRLRQIGKLARRDIERHVKQHIFLELQVWLSTQP